MSPFLLNQSTGGRRAPLDRLATRPSGVYALRRMLSSWSGQCINVRRSSDNATADIGFNPAGLLDTATLLSFVGANTGQITAWYDQSGNGAHLTQATLAYQPTIVTAGVVRQVNGQASPYFGAGANSKLLVAAASIKVGSVGAVHAATTVGNFADWGCVWGGVNNYIYLAHVLGSTNINAQRSDSVYASVTVNGISTSSVAPINTLKTMFAIYQAQTTTEGSNWGVGGGWDSVEGYIPEAVVFPGLVSDADRRMVERNQQVFFSIAGS